MTVTPEPDTGNKVLFSKYKTIWSAFVKRPNESIERNKDRSGMSVWLKPHFCVVLFAIFYKSFFPLSLACGYLKGQCLKGHLVANIGSESLTTKMPMVLIFHTPPNYQRNSEL